MSKNMKLNHKKQGKNIRFYRFLSVNLYLLARGYYKQQYKVQFMENFEQEKNSQSNQQEKEIEEKAKPKNWTDDEKIFQLWKNYQCPPGACEIIQKRICFSLQKGVGVPCYRPNVMNVDIPAGSRAGKRPCGSTWGASGGYITNYTRFVYCQKCVKAWKLTEGVDPKQVFG